MRYILFTFLVTIALSFTAFANTDYEIKTEQLAIDLGVNNCKEAVQLYNKVLPILALALESYEECVKGSHGVNSCQDEINKVVIISISFESSVRVINHYCEVADDDDE